MKSKKYPKLNFLILIIFFFLIIFFIFSYFPLTVSGFSIKESISENYKSLPLSSKVLFISVWVVFILIFVGMFIRDKLILKKEEENLDLRLNYGKFQTDLDVLYDVLKKRKKLKIKTVSKAFEVDFNQAMDWAKILESGKIASIEYPGLFGDPEIVIR